MQDNTNADGESDKTKKNDNRAQHKVVWRIVIGGVVGVLIILFASIFFPNLTERTKFFTTNALSALVLDVIIVQAYIYRKQWEAMQSQLRLMRATEETLRRQADAFEAQVTTMQGESAAMQDSLTETRNLVIQTERAVEIARVRVEVSEQTAIYAQRAYLTGQVQWAGPGHVHYLIIQNSGNTPANNVFISFTSTFRDAAPDGHDAGFDRLEQIGLLAPKARYAITNGGIEETEANGSSYYCWGIIFYEDIFEKARRTNFCFCITPAADTTVRPCTRGNRAE